MWGGSGRWPASPQEAQRRWSAPGQGLLMLQSGEASSPRLLGLGRCWEPQDKGAHSDRGPYKEVTGSGKEQSPGRQDSAGTR